MRKTHGERSSITTIMWKFKHLPCSKCGSSDALSVHEDGHSYCFSCNTYFGDKDTNTNMEQEFTYEYLPWRGVTADTFKYYEAKTQIRTDGKPDSIRFKYSGDYTKCRRLDTKTFYSEGVATPGLFGIDKFSAGSSKFVTLTEGELDACSLYQVIRTPVLSVRSASSGLGDVTIHRSWLNAHERIYLAFDGDTAGKELTAKVAKLFDYSKVYHVKFTKHKDANDYLRHGDGEELKHLWWNSKKYVPENIISSLDEFASILKKKQEPGVPFPWDTLTKMTYGIKTSESVLITAMEGVGKTEVMHNIEYKLLKETDANVGAIYLEEPKQRHLRAIAGIELRKPVHLPDTDATEDQILSALTKVIRVSDRLFLYSHFGSDDAGILLDTIRFLVSGCGCRYILFDHLTMAVSGLAGENERIALDHLCTQLEMMVKELDFSLIMVSHVNDQGQTRSSRMASKIADIRLDLYRDILNPDPTIRNRIDMSISKNRFYSSTGSAGSILFDPLTYTYSELKGEDHDHTCTQGQQDTVPPC